MLQKEIHKIMNDKLINSKNKAIVFINNFYDSLQNRITLSEGLLSFVVSIIGFYIVHAAYFVERYLNEYFHYTVRDVIDVFFTGVKPLIGRFLGGFISYFNSWTVCFICAIITNNYDYAKSQYEWYIYTGGEVIEKFGYSDDNSMSYTVQSDGKYTIQEYTKDIATNEVQVLYTYTFEVIDGQIQSK